MFASILILFFLPWLDRSKIRSGYYRPMFKIFYVGLILDFVLLGYLGAQAPEGIYVFLSQIATLYYFGYFLVILPFISNREKPIRLPESIDEYYKATHKSK